MGKKNKREYQLCKTNSFPPSLYDTQNPGKKLIARVVEEYHLRTLGWGLIYRQTLWGEAGLAVGDGEPQRHSQSAGDITKNMLSFPTATLWFVSQQESTETLPGVQRSSEQRHGEQLCGEEECRRRFRRCAVKGLGKWSGT